MGVAHILTNFSQPAGDEPIQLSFATLQRSRLALRLDPSRWLVMYSKGISNKIWQKIVYIGMNIEF